MALDPSGQFEWIASHLSPSVLKLRKDLMHTIHMANTEIDPVEAGKIWEMAHKKKEFIDEVDNNSRPFEIKDGKIIHPIYIGIPMIEGTYSYSRNERYAPRLKNNIP